MSQSYLNLRLATNVRMKNNIFILFFLLFSIGSLAEAGPGKGGLVLNRTVVTLPGQPPQTVFITVTLEAPVLLAPLDEVVDLSGKDELIFKWKLVKEYFNIYYYDFHIYRGSQMTNQNEVFSKEVSTLDKEVSVPAETFKNGEVYFWSVKQVELWPDGTIHFSDPAYRSFKAVNNQEGAK